jgi:hypothetical protein
MARHKCVLNIIAIVAATHIIAACGSTASRSQNQWQPSAISDFKSVSGTWEGLMIRDPRDKGDDWVTFVISESGAYQFASPRLIGVFSGKGNLALADGKMVAKSDKGGQLTLQLYRDPGGNERMLKADGKDSHGFTYVAELKRSR